MSGSLTIHIYDPAADYYADLIRAAAPDREIVALSSPLALTMVLPEITVLFAPDPPREGWADARLLRLVQLGGVGADHFLPSPDLPASVEVAGMRGAFSADVAEHVLAMMFAHARRIRELLAEQVERKFEQSPRGTLAGKTLAIVGFGSIGQHLARVALALGMRVRAVSRRSGARGHSPGSQPVRITSDLDRNVQTLIEGVAMGTVAEAIADAHYIAITVPLTPETRNLFDAAMLARLRPDAFLINVGRGGIVDESALVAALQANRFAGAAFDVFETEPLPPDHVLWTLPNLIITPHTAGLGDNYLPQAIEIFLDNVERLEAGTPRRNLVDRNAGY